MERFLKTMCGIVGFNWKDRKMLERALKATHHRGPDATGMFLDRKVSLGHNRLSIVDLSPLGKQPMTNEKKTIWITFNGEIYNHQDIKKSLKKKHQFRSRTDTEALIHLYEEEGVEMLKHLIGMFAFCIYDAEKQILFIARDRVGIKPLYYYHQGSSFVFSSEIKGMLATGKIPRKLNTDALPFYLTFRANVSDHSFIHGIKKLPPGHFLIYDLKRNTLKIEQYWKLLFHHGDKSEGLYRMQLQDLLEDSVRLRLMSDVPYGAYLSGGIDSGMIVALMSKYSPQPIKTFSVGFKEDNHSELQGAKFLSIYLGTDHHELVIDRKAVHELPKIVYHCDEPLADPTIIPTYFLAQYNKKYSTVILTGEGADELFAGYPQYKFMKLHSLFLSKLPYVFRKFLFEIVKRTPKTLLNKLFSYTSALGEKGLERFSCFLLSNDFSEQYLNQIAIFNEEEQRELLRKEVSLYKNYQSHFPQKQDIVSSCQEFDFETSLVEDLLMKIDKQAMAFAVEGRVPFLDHRVVELAAQIPAHLKLRGLSKDKYILREIARNFVPLRTTKRKKRHFFVPIDKWLDMELEPLMNLFFSEEYIKKQNLFNYAYIQKIKEDFSKSRLYYARQLWTLLVFQIWYRQYIENKKVEF